MLPHNGPDFPARADPATTAVTDGANCRREATRFGGRYGSATDHDPVSYWPGLAYPTTRRSLAAQSLTGPNILKSA
jgi:hypothetical protein